MRRRFRPRTRKVTIVKNYGRRSRVYRRRRRTGNSSAVKTLLGM